MKGVIVNEPSELQLQKVSPKVIKAWFSDDSAGISIDYSSVILSAGPKVAIGLDVNSGIVIKGNIGITGYPSSVSFAGLWKFNDLMLSTIPSTIITPNPVLRFTIPTSNMLGVMTEITKILGSFVA